MKFTYYVMITLGCAVPMYAAEQAATATGTDDQTVQKEAEVPADKAQRVIVRLHPSKDASFTPVDFKFEIGAESSKGVFPTTPQELLEKLVKEIDEQAEELQAKVNGTGDVMFDQEDEQDHITLAVQRGICLDSAYNPNTCLSDQLGKLEIVQHHLLLNAYVKEPTLPAKTAEVSAPQDTVKQKNRCGCWRAFARLKARLSPKGNAKTT